MSEWREYELKCLVYVARNKINGKCYIGATDRGLAFRSNRHKWRAEHGEKSKFCSAIRKYGFDAFEFSILQICKDFFEALEYERKFIAELKPEYNMTAGGGGVKGLKFSAESREKMSAAKRGKRPAWCDGPNASEIQKTLSLKAKLRPSRGPLSREHAIKFTQAGNAARRRAVFAIHDQKRYESVSDAARAYGLTSGQVVYYCKGNHESRRGVDFRYADEENDQ